MQLLSLFRRPFEWMQHWLWGTIEVPPLPAVIIHEPERLPPPDVPPIEQVQRIALTSDTTLETVPPQTRLKRGENPGMVWQFRTTILDRLDEYFSCMHRLKRHDHRSYQLFSRVGLAIPADRYACGMGVSISRKGPQAICDDLPRPAIGGILCGGWQDEREKEKTIAPSFLYFHKVKAPSAVQPASGDIYAVTMVFDNRKKRWKWKSTLSAPVGLHVVIAASDGMVRILKERVVHRHQIQRQQGRTREHLTISNTEWQYPTWIADVLQDSEGAWQDPHAWAGFLFGLALSTYVGCLNAIVVRAKKDGMTASFGIALPHAKRFFRDRETTALARDGRRKRIFHSVRAHVRHLDASRVTDVRQHYRGLRHFDWQGTRIGIVLPDQIDLRNFTAPMIYKTDLPPAERASFMSQRKAAIKIDEALSR